MFYCNTTLKVETSEGYASTYLGQSSVFGITFHIIYVTAGNSVTHAVAEMLEDPKIISYLTKQ